MSDFDWDAALESAESGGVVPAGEGYTLEVDAAEAKVAKTGSPMVWLQLKVVGGPNDGQLVWTNLVSKPGSEKSRRMFTVQVLAFGVTKEWLASTKPSFEQLAKELVGRRAMATLSIKQMDKGPQNEVENLTPIHATKPLTLTVPTTPSPPAPPSAPSPPNVSATPSPSMTPPVAPPTATDEEPF